MGIMLSLACSHYWGQWSASGMSSPWWESGTPPSCHMAVSGLKVLPTSPPPRAVPEETCLTRILPPGPRPPFSIPLLPSLVLISEAVSTLALPAALPELPVSSSGLSCPAGSWGLAPLTRYRISRPLSPQLFAAHRSDFYPHFADEKSKGLVQ